MSAYADEPAALSSAPVYVERIAGAASVETSVGISEEAFPDGSEWVVLARSDDYADAMSATGLAGVLKCPIVLTDRMSLSDEARAEIVRLGATKAYVIGGAGAMPGNFANELAALGVDLVGRVSGPESWDTSAACAAKIVEHGGNEQGCAIVATSSNFQDVLSMSSFAYAYAAPIYLQNSSKELPAVSLAGIKSLTGTVYVAGGNGAVPTASVEGVLPGRAVVRLAGRDGYDTSNQIATYMVENGLLSASTVCVACGALPAKGTDALAGAALAGSRGGVMLLVNSNTSLGSERLVTLSGADSKGASGFLSVNAGDVSQAYVLGGRAVVPVRAACTMQDILGSDFGYFVLDGSEGYAEGDYVGHEGRYYPYCGAGAYLAGFTGAGSSAALPSFIAGSDTVFADVSDEGLAVLDASMCPTLDSLYCGGNALSVLDVSGNPALRRLYCNDNAIASLDTSGNSALVVLYCNDNGALASLDVSGNPDLAVLSCGGNALTSLSVSANGKLTYLSCPGNALTSLSVSANVALTALDCSGNALSSLNVTGNSALTALDCSNNVLAELDVSANRSLIYLYCYGNLIADTSALEAWLDPNTQRMGEVLPQATGARALAAEAADHVSAVAGAADADRAALFESLAQDACASACAGA